MTATNVQARRGKGQSKRPGRRVEHACGRSDTKRSPYWSFTCAFFLFFRLSLDMNRTLPPTHIAGVTAAAAAAKGMGHAGPATARAARSAGPHAVQPRRSMTH